MTNINTNENKTVLEIRNEMAINGVEMEIVYVNGQRFCVLGYASEADKKASLDAIEKAVKASNGNLYEAAMKLTTIAALHEAAPDEEMEIGGKSCYISYANRTLYDANGNEICNCNDLECALPNEAIKALLTERAQ